MTYTITELARQAGIALRTAQLWADRDVIWPVEDTDMGGPGVHRRFPQDEVRLACVLGPLSNFGVRIGTLFKIAQELRETLERELSSGKLAVTIKRGDIELKVNLDKARAVE